MYKVLRKDLTSPFKGFQYELGKEYVCEDFDDSDRECSDGFYAVPIDGIPYAWSNTGELAIFEVENGGRERVFNQYKQRFEKQTIIREIPVNEVVEEAKKVEGELGYKLSEVILPRNPLLIEAEVTERHKELLREWASVWASVGASVWDSVWASVRASVGDSVRDSVWDSVGAYISSIFTSIDNWKYIEHQTGVNPYQSCIDLWMDNLVPSFDGKTWRLHTGPKAKVVYEWVPE